MIEAYIGLPGRGKTYALTARVLVEHRRRPHRPVWSTTPLRLERRTRGGLLVTETVRYDDLTSEERASAPAVLMTAPRQLLDAPQGALIVVDEAHAWFDARDSLRLPEELRGRLSQTRHAYWDILWSSQDWSQVDKRLRNVTNWVYVCTAWFARRTKTDRRTGEIRREGHPILFCATRHEPGKLGKRARHAGREWRFFRRAVAAAYDTRHSVAAAQHRKGAAG